MRFLKVSSTGTVETLVTLHMGPAMTAAQASRRIEGHHAALMGRNFVGSGNRTRRGPSLFSSTRKDVWHSRRVIAAPT